MFETEIKENLNCRSKFIVDIQNCKFRLEINKDYEEEAQEIIEEILKENRESIEAWMKNWKENEIEKTIYEYCENDKTYQIVRAYYLECGQIQFRKTETQATILVNPYIKDKDILDKIQEKLFEVA